MTLREELARLTEEWHDQATAVEDRAVYPLALAAANLALEAAARECERKVRREAGYGGEFGGYGGWDGDKTGTECAAAIHAMRVK